MAYFLSPVLNEQQFDANGDPRAGALITTYLAGTLTAVTTYKTSTGTAHTNPIQLDSSGNYPNGTQLWLLGGLTYKFVITDANGANSRTYDNISGIGDTANTTDEWLLFAGAPTYINATSFSVVGDQTNIFEARRRLKSTNTGGTVYSTIANSLFGAGITTVTVVNTSGVLDSGLSQVSYGLLAPINPSIPEIYSPRATRVDVASVAGTVDLTASATTTDDIQFTGNNAITGFTVVVGRVIRFVVATGATPSLVASASIDTQTGANIQLNPGGSGVLRATAANTVEVLMYVDAGPTSPTLMTPVTLSGVADATFNFPFTPKKFSVLFNAASLSDANRYRIQLGTASAFEVIGYLGATTLVVNAAATVGSTDTVGIPVTNNGAANLTNGKIDFICAGSNIWIADGGFNVEGSGSTIQSTGRKTLAGALTRVRVIPEGGAATLDSGTINVIYE